MLRFPVYAASSYTIFTIYGARRFSHSMKSDIFNFFKSVSSFGIVLGA